jgi:hypothetical protein
MKTISMATMDDYDGLMHRVRPQWASQRLVNGSGCLIIFVIRMVLIHVFARKLF